MQVAGLEWDSSNVITTRIESKVSDKIKDHLAQKRANLPKRNIPTFDPKMVQLSPPTQMLLFSMLVVHDVVMSTSKQKRYRLS